MLGQLFRSFGGSRRDRRLTHHLTEDLRLQGSGDLDGAIASYTAALDRAYRTQVKRRISEASDVLFDDVGTVRPLESFFSEAVARARSDGPLRTGAAIACKET